MEPKSVPVLQRSRGISVQGSCCSVERNRIDPRVRFGIAVEMFQHSGPNQQRFGLFGRKAGEPACAEGNPRTKSSMPLTRWAISFSSIRCRPNSLRSRAHLNRCHCLQCQVVEVMCCRVARVPPSNSTRLSQKTRGAPHQSVADEGGTACESFVEAIVDHSEALLLQLCRANNNFG